MEKEKVLKEFQAASKGFEIYKDSFATREALMCFMAKLGSEKKLIAVSAGGKGVPFSGSKGPELSDHLSTVICDCNHENAEVLRKFFPFTAPSVIGLKSAFGTGDRTGLATPGHVRAFADTELTPVFAAQSVRELTRCHRTPRDILDDVSWSLFQTQFKRPFVFDADHLKEEKDFETFSEAGATMFTCDPSDYVNSEVDSMSDEEIENAFSELDDRKALEERYLNKEFRIDAPMALHPLVIRCEKKMLHKSAVKYYRAAGRSAELYRHARKIKGGSPFDFEVSVDETDSPTGPFDHIFVAQELKRLGVKFQSLALRFIGSFEKAVDYIGDPKRFENEFRIHAAIARSLGPYKLGIHSGSDKFMVYPIIGKYAGDLLHVKTSGTSWLEALRVVAMKNPELFKEIYLIAYNKFDEHKASYHISSKRSTMPEPEELGALMLPGLLDRDDTRQLLHIAYGSILSESALKSAFAKTLMENEELHYRTVARHIEKHIEKLRLTEGRIVRKRQTATFIPRREF